MTKIKICGLRREKDVQMVNKWQPDLAGFVFAPGRRQVDRSTALHLRLLLKPEIPAVGVFVNASIPEIAALVHDGIIQMVQLHGDETPEYIRALKQVAAAPVIKAIRVKNPESLENLDRYPCEYFLLDAFSKEQYGGLGQSFDHSLLTGKEIPKPYFLAGGLNPDNGGEAVRTLHPYGVDISSGVETDGWKDENKISAFVRAVRKEDAK